MHYFNSWKAVFLLFLICIPAILAAQTIRYVPSQFTTITAAINASNNGDTIDITGIISEPQINITKNLVIRGHGRTNTIISCLNTITDTVVFYLSGNVTAIIRDMKIQKGKHGIIINNANLTLLNCSISNNVYYGVLNRFSSTNTFINISNCEILNNMRGIYNDNKKGTIIISKTNISYNNATKTYHNHGGGIYNVGTMQLSSCTISNNNLSGSSYMFGAGIYNEGTMLLLSCTISNNNLSGSFYIFGAGIYNEGTLQSDFCLITNNTSKGDTSRVYGVGIYNRGSLLVNFSSIINNTGTIDSFYSSGGGIYNFGKAEINYSLIAKNNLFGNKSKSNAINGAGLYNFIHSKLTINNSTVCQNKLTGNTYVQGAGIYTEDSLIINNSTISKNEISSYGGYAGGGGINVESIWGDKIRIKNTIIAGNVVNGKNNADFYKDDTNSCSYGYNLIGQSSALNFNAIGDIKGQNPLLDTLKDNGGNTSTLALLNGSPAINAGNSTDIDGNPVTTDQRKFVRLNRVDIGAYEWDGLGISAKQISDNICGIRQNLAILKIELILPDTFTVKGFRFNTMGTSNPSDIINAKLYYSGNIDSFSLSTSNQYGGTVNVPNGNFQIDSTMVLKAGFNYFWLTYDISNSAPEGSYFDAYCPQIILRDIKRIPIDTIPSGNRTIPVIHADFQINDTSQCLSGNSFVFKNSSTTTSGTLTNLWDFGDHTYSSVDSVTHNYSTSNTYNINLRVMIADGCADSITKSIIVLPPPQARFGINNPVQCLNVNQFIFTDSSTDTNGSIVGKFWDLGDGHTDSSGIVTHSYLNYDSFDIKLIVSSDMGCRDTVIKNVIVLPLPDAKFIAYDSSQCLERNNFAFTNKSSSNNGSFNCKWNFGDSLNSTLFNPIHKYSYADTFTVTLIITDTLGCNDTFSKHTWVHVHPEPLANFSVNDSSQCLIGNVFVQSNSSNIKSGSFIQKWEFDDGNDTNSYNSSHSYSMADSYMVKLLIVSDWGCKDSILKKVYVRPMPIAGFLMNTNPQYLPGNNYSFTNKTTVPSGTIHSYWDFGDGDTSSQTDPSHKYQKVDTFDVKLIAISDYGCKDSISQKVWLLYIPMNIQFNVKNDCLGDTVFFKNNSTVAPPDSFLNFLWDFGDGNTIMLKEPKHIYASAGTYFISLVALTAFGSKDTLTDTFEIFADPVVNITASPGTIVITGSPVTLTATGLYDQLLWFDNSTAGSVNVTSEGTYWVIASYNNGCKSSDTIILTKGEIKEPELVNVITPNGDGINDYLIVQNIDQIKPCKLSIYNRWGDELFSTSDYQNNWDGKYKGKSLPEGTYYYVLVAKDGRVYKGAVNILK